MPFCANCGVSVNNSDRFCQQCGMPRVSGAGIQQAPPSPPQPAPALPYDCALHQPSQSQPQVVATLPNARMMTPAGSGDIYTIAFTPYRALFAKLTGQVVLEVKTRVATEGKAAGKGWLGRANDQMRAMGKVHERYISMLPAEVLAETPGNFALDHASISSVEVKQVYEPNYEDGPGDPYTELFFNIQGGRYRFRTGKSLKDTQKMLENFYPGRVKR